MPNKKKKTHRRRPCRRSACSCKPEVNRYYVLPLQVVLVVPPMRKYPLLLLSLAQLEWHRHLLLLLLLLVMILLQCNSHFPRK